MFIEYPQVLQPVFDAFNRDPAKGGLLVPAKITGADGQPLTTPEAEGGLRFLNENRRMFPQTVEMWRAARDAGIRIHAVDSDANAYARSTKQVPPLLFNAEGPLMSQLHEYIGAPTRSGRTIALGIEVGNSFSAPYLAARERYRRQNQ